MGIHEDLEILQQERKERGLTRWVFTVLYEDKKKWWGARTGDSLTYEYYDDIQELFDYIEAKEVERSSSTPS